MASRFIYTRKCMGPLMRDLAGIGELGGIQSGIQAELRNHIYVMVKEVTDSDPHARGASSMVHFQDFHANRDSHDTDMFCLDGWRLYRDIIGAASPSAVWNSTHQSYVRDPLSGTG